MEVRFLVQNLATEIRFFFIAGAQRVLESMKLELEALILVKPVLVMELFYRHLWTFPHCSILFKKI